MSSISVKIKRRSSVDEEKAMPLFIQVIYRRKVGQIPLSEKLSGREWDAAEQHIRIPPGALPAHVVALLRLQEKLDRIRILLWKHIGGMEKNGNLSIPALVDAGSKQQKLFFWQTYMEQEIELLNRRGKTVTARHYASACNSFSQFLHEHDDLGECNARNLRFDEIDEPLLRQFQAWLAARRLAANTVVFYFRILRALWNKAANDGIVEKGYAPFNNIKLREEKTKKRAVEEKVIRRLEELQQPGALHQSLTLACDLFLFCYYARGMSFVDLAHLTRNNIRGKKLVYKRCKTGKELQIELLPEMMELIKKYAGTSPAGYLFPILHSEKPTTREYESALRLQNKRLKKLSHIVGAKLTTHVARHSWASIASQKGIALEDISECMGHSSLKVTRIYIGLLDNSRLDQANKIVIRSKHKPFKRMQRYVL